jgi:NADH:ubiquinone reductase (H+-translocating)
LTRPRVLIVGAGFAGFHCARELERLLGPSEAELTLASPVDYMLYSPLLPQVAAGVLTPQAGTVSLRRALRRTLRAPCSITGIDLEGRACVARAVTGEVHTVPWDYLVLCPGAVTRTFGTPGGEQHGRGMKTLAQATHLHDHVLAELELGNAVGDERRRAAHCTFVVAGAGYAGVETAAALHLFTRRLIPRFINLRPQDLRWVLADVAPRILPELGGKLSAAALAMLRQRGIEMRLGTGIAQITESAVRFTDGAELPSHTAVWTAGVLASPLIGALGLETAASGRLRVTPELQVPGQPEVFSAGDAAAVPDLTRDRDAITPPTAQHAQRQGITVARNIARRLRGQPLVPYRHRDLGLGVDLGGSQAVARPLGRHLSGIPAQLVTRGYHLYALPSPRARVRTAADWLMHAALGDDFTRLGLPDPMSGALAGQEPAGQYLSRDEARQETARILAHDQGGWLT